MAWAFKWAGVFWVPNKRFAETWNMFSLGVSLVAMKEPSGESSWAGSGPAIAGIDIDINNKAVRMLFFTEGIERHYIGFFGCRLIFFQNFFLGGLAV